MPTCNTARRFLFLFHTTKEGINIMKVDMRICFIIVHSTVLFCIIQSSYLLRGITNHSEQLDLTTLLLRGLRLTDA